MDDSIYIQAVEESLWKGVINGDINPSEAATRVKAMRTPFEAPDFSRIGTRTGVEELDTILLGWDLRYVLDSLMLSLNQSLDRMDETIASLRTQQEDSEKITAKRFKDMGGKFREMEHSIGILMNQLDNKKQRERHTGGIGWDSRK